MLSIKLEIKLVPISGSKTNTKRRRRKIYNPNDSYRGRLFFPKHPQLWFSERADTSCWLIIQKPFNTNKCNQGGIDWHTMQRTFNIQTSLILQKLKVYSQMYWMFDTSWSLRLRLGHFGASLIQSETLGQDMCGRSRERSYHTTTLRPLCGPPTWTCECVFAHAHTHGNADKGGNYIFSMRSDGASMSPSSKQTHTHTHRDRTLKYTSSISNLI